MASRIRFASLILLLICPVLSETAQGQTSVVLPAPDVVQLLSEDSAPALFFAGPIPRSKSVANDATLNDVCGVGSNCWAVGERGVVLRSHDAGQTWETSVLSTECSLASVCFLTNQTGFVAGSRYDSLNRRRRPVLLSTRDGGQTWRDHEHESERLSGVEPGMIATADLPPLTWVRFFDLENAIVIGSADFTNAPGQVFRSNDGGKTWQALKSDVDEAQWKSGAFLSVNDGFVVGRGNALGVAVSQQVVALARPQNSLRQIHAASLAPSGQGWLAGDAGFLQHSEDGGITWKPATTALPPQYADVVDFRTICQRGNTICVGGSPGSLLLKSTDAGASWSAAKLPDPAPIHRINFVDDSTVLAVGSFGIVHRSNDAGETWRTVRNSGYRAAVMCLTTNPTDVSFHMLSAISGDEGFRTVVIQPSARLSRSGIDDGLAADRLAAALPQVGANAFVQDWMFSRTQPLQATVADELMKAWGRQTDGRVGELLPQRLAEFIRIWRPDVLCVERSSDDDQVATVWLQALDVAMNIAAGKDHRSNTLDSVGLPPWTVSRIVVRQTDDRQSPLQFDGPSLLSNVGTTSDLIADYCRHQLVGPPDTEQGETFESPSSASYAVHDSSGATATFRHLLAGMMQAPGTESRRLLTPADPQRRDQMQRLTQQVQLQRAALSSQARRSDTPLNLIAHLSQIGAGMPERLAMQQLLSLEKMYAAVENLDGRIAVLQDITDRFPESPEAADAHESLFQFYSSAELRLLRQRGELRDSGAGISQPNSTDNDSSSQNPNIRQVAGSIPGISKPPVYKAGTGTALSNPQGSASAAVAELWDRKADAALRSLNRLSPDRAATPELLLRHAANFLRRGDYNKNNSVLSLAANAMGRYALLARAEMQAVHGAASTSVPVINIAKSQSKPLLDTRLTDLIWEEAVEIPLATAESADASPDSGCLMMLAWDDDHVYISGRVERVPGRDYVMDKTAERRHDSDHGIRDRVHIAFDTDRDYTTAFHFTIDEAGQTSERCWTSRRWNPDWFVAADIDETSWRFEIAIPQEELLARPVKAGDLWAVRIHRIVPGILQQSLKHTESDTATADTAGYGLLRFTRR